MIRNAKTLYTPFSRQRTEDIEGLIIVHTPGQGLLRVRDTHGGDMRYSVELLTPSGWCTYLELTDAEAASPEDALQVWLNIEDSLSPAPPDPH